MRVYCVFGVPWWPRGQPRDHTATRVHIPHSAGTQARLATRQERPPPPETRAMAGSRCAHTTTTMLHDQTHQEARPNEQSMHPSASDDTRSQQAHTRRAVTARQDRCQPTTRVRASDKHAHACTAIQTTKSTTPKDQAAHASGRSCVPANPPPRPPRQPHQRHDKKNNRRIECKRATNARAISDNAITMGDCRS